MKCFLGWGLVARNGNMRGPEYKRGEGNSRKTYESRKVFQIATARSKSSSAVVEQSHSWANEPQIQPGKKRIWSPWQTLPVRRGAGGCWSLSQGRGWLWGHPWRLGSRRRAPNGSRRHKARKLRLAPLLAELRLLCAQCVFHTEPPLLMTSPLS